jgi:hypothetical protein
VLATTFRTFWTPAKGFRREMRIFFSFAPLSVECYHLSHLITDGIVVDLKKSENRLRTTLY